MVGSAGILWSGGTGLEQPCKVGGGQGHELSQGSGVGGAGLGPSPWKDLTGQLVKARVDEQWHVDGECHRNYMIVILAESGGRGWQSACCLRFTPEECVRVRVRVCVVSIKNRLYKGKETTSPGLA